jgi:hypothetical protein
MVVGQDQRRTWSLTCPEAGPQLGAYGKPTSFSGGVLSGWRRSV